MNTVIPGRAKREPGIHNHQLGIWIPDLRASHASRNDRDLAPGTPMNPVDSSPLLIRLQPRKNFKNFVVETSLVELRQT